MKKMMFVALATTALLVGCDGSAKAAYESSRDQVKALISHYGPLPACHDPEMLDAVKTIVQQQASALEERGSPYFAEIEWRLMPDLTSVTNIFDDTESGSQGRRCHADYSIEMNHGENAPAFLKRLIFGSALQNEVLGIQGLSSSRPRALDHPPTLMGKETLMWRVGYSIRKTSDGKAPVVFMDADDVSSIADFSRLFIRAYSNN